MLEGRAFVGIFVDFVGNTGRQRVMAEVVSGLEGFIGEFVEGIVWRAEAGLGM